MLLVQELLKKSRVWIMKLFQPEMQSKLKHVLEKSDF